jgi:hypothetical protein
MKEITTFFSAAVVVLIAADVQAGDLDPRFAEKYGPAAQIVASQGVGVFPPFPDSYPINAGQVVSDAYSVTVNEAARSAGMVPARAYHDGTSTIIELPASVRDQAPSVWAVRDGMLIPATSFYPKAQQTADQAVLVIAGAGGRYALKRGAEMVEIEPRR